MINKVNKLNPYKDDDYFTSYQQKMGLNNRYADFINQHVGETT